MDNNNTQNGFQVDDAPEGEISVSISDDEIGSSEDSSEVEAAQPEKPKVQEKKQNKHPFKERISKLVHENRNKDYVNLTLKQQLEEKERELAHKDEMLRQKDSINSQLFESNKQTEERSILSNLRQAKEEGDIDEEIKYSQDLARIKAEQMAYDVLKIQQQYQPQPVQEETTFYPTIDYQSASDHDIEMDLPEEYTNFLDRNTWANPESSNYSERLRAEADLIASEFNESLKFNNQAHLIGTQDYFDSIEGLMRDRYAPPSEQEDDSSYEQEPVQYQQQRRTPPAAGVSRRGSTMADQYISQKPGQSNKAYTLTEKEYNWARNLKIPNGPTGNQQFLSSDKVIQEWAKNKEYFRKNPVDTRRDFASTQWGFQVPD